MKYKNCLFFVIILCAFILTGCKNNNDDKTNIDNEYSLIHSITYASSFIGATMDEIKIVIEDDYNRICVNDYYYGQLRKTQRRVLSDDEVNKILKACKSSRILNWKEEYVDENILDGAQWDVTIEMNDGTKRRTYFSNLKPKKYSYFEDAVYDFMLEGEFIDVYDFNDVKQLNISSKEEAENISDEVLTAIAIGEFETKDIIVDYNIPETFDYYIGVNDFWRLGYTNNTTIDTSDTTDDVTNDIDEAIMAYMSNLADLMKIYDFEVVYCGETDEYEEYLFKYTEARYIYLNYIYEKHEFPVAYRIIFLKNIYEYDIENNPMYKSTGELTSERVKTMFEILTYIENAHNDKVLIHREVEETDEEFIYTYYYYYTYNGGIGVKDSVFLDKRDIVLDKEIHAYTLSNVVNIKEIEVDEYILGW